MEPAKINYYQQYYKNDPEKMEQYRNNRVHYYNMNQEKERKAALARYYKRKAAKLAAEAKTEAGPNLPVLA